MIYYILFLESYFDKETYSLDYFCNSYLKKCKEKGLFEIFIHFLIKNPLYQNKYIENENDLFTFMIFQRTSDKRINRNLWKLWMESFNELNLQVQKLLLYHLKLAIDRIVDETVVDYGAYEDILFNNKYMYDTVTIEYHCLKCDSDFYFSKSEFTLNYLKKLFHGIITEKVCIVPWVQIKCAKYDCIFFKFTII